MPGARKDARYPFHGEQNNPLYLNEEIVDSPENEIDVVNVTNGDIEVDYEEADEEGFYVEMLDQAPVIKRARRDNHIGRKQEKIENIAYGIASDKVNLIELGTDVMIGTSNKTLNESNVEKAVKNGAETNSFLGDISLEALVKGMMTPSASDGRYAMLGTSVMWNALKSNMRDLKTSIMEQTTMTYGEPRFDAIDLNIENIPDAERTYEIQSVGVFSNADLYYVFSLLRFRQSAKLLNKTKQFLKAYFIVACRPRCMIWRYTLRRSGNSKKKAILNLPNSIVQTILNLLIDLTGIGSGDRLLEELDPNTPFIQSLGENEVIREQRYYEACKLKDPLICFFRDAITDTLNEIREMPFCLTSGMMISPLRGREKRLTCVMWKDYEDLLKEEQDQPSESNIKKRMKFEQRLCENCTRNELPLR